MAVYEYEHVGRGCKRGKVFELEMPMSAPTLTACPECGRPVKKLISLPTLSFPKSNSQLKDQGFTKLVRRDSGVYENVTARSGEDRVVQLGDHSTYPDLKKGRKK